MQDELILCPLFVQLLTLSVVNTTRILFIIIFGNCGFGFIILLLIFLILLSLKTCFAVFLVIHMMLSSDEEIPCVEENCRYNVEFLNSSGDKKKIIVRKIRGGKYRKHQRSGIMDSPKANTRKLRIGSSPQKCNEDSNSKKEKSKILNHSLDKLKPESITDLLCESNSSDSDESEDIISLSGSKKQMGNTPGKAVQNAAISTSVIKSERNLVKWKEKYGEDENVSGQVDKRTRQHIVSRKDDIDDVYNTPKKRRKLEVDIPSSCEKMPKERIKNDFKVQTPKSKKTKNLEEECTPEKRSTTVQSLKKVATPTTPSRRGTPKRLPCTPLMPICNRNVSTPKTPLQDAMTRLHVSAVPGSLPCREREYKNIYYFLEGKILDGAGGCMYISGVPGTGKTATVREVVRSLQEEACNERLPSFQFFEMNSMRLSHPRQAYVQLWKFLTGEVATAEQAQRLLENNFTRSSKKKTSFVLLVDEVDVLWTKRQDVVYNLLDWPSKNNSRLVVVTIANTMDLPERLLMGRVTSRLGLTRLTFQPYTYQQLEEIVKARLKGLNAFDRDAIQFVSRKVASVSGDARRALDICRRATEIAEQESPQTLVSIKHVDEAMLSMTSSRTVQAITQSCSTLEQLFLQAVEADLARTGLEETTFSKAYTMLETLCSLEGLTFPSPKKVKIACMRLCSLRLLLSQQSNTDIYARIFLNMSVDDLHYALQEIRKGKNKK